jgi:hypothetical protein
MGPALAIEGCFKNRRVLFWGPGDGNKSLVLCRFEIDTSNISQTGLEIIM